VGAILLLAPLTFAQAEKTAGSDAATAEAQRQGTVALKPTVSQSPSQSVRQAVAFERYKELAAEREARKMGRSSSADRSVDSTKPVRVKK